MPIDLEWRSHHAAKVTTPGAAVRAIPRGRRILIASGAAEPVSLVEALISDGDHLADNEIVHLLTLGPAPYTEHGLESRFRHTAFFIGWAHYSRFVFVPHSPSFFQKITFGLAAIQSLVAQLER